MRHQLGPKLMILSHVMRRQVSHIAEEYQLSDAQSRILHYIAEESTKHDVYQRNLESEFHVRRSSITSLLQQLEKNGLLQRVSVQSDARLKKLILTEKGNIIQAEIGRKIDAFDETIYNLLEEDKEQFLNQLDGLINKLIQLEIAECKEGKND